MNAILQAARTYDATATHPFSDALAAHLMHGFVFSEPTAFVLARPVRLASSDAEKADFTRPHAGADCWFVWLAAGNLARCVAHLPYPLPWIAFHRIRQQPEGTRLPLHVFPLHRFLARASALHSQSTT